MQTISELAFIDAAGYHYSDYPSFLTWIQGQYKAIYGQDVYLGADSQDGQFLAILAQAFFDTAALGASVYNSFSPVSAQGAGLSRVVKINGIERGKATHSTVDLTIVGTAGTTIVNGIAIDGLKQQWALPASVTIPGGGTIVVTSTAVSPGAIAALPSTITGIFTPTQGWQTVNNVAAATLGAPVISDAQLRTQQAQSTANPSLTVFEGTVGAVEGVTGVTAARGYENPTGTTDANGLPPHSISIVAAGGTDQNVAAAIQVHKTPGTQTYGTTSVLVDDSHGMPITINFYRPTNATIGVEVTITPGASYVSSTADLIAAALAAAVSSPEIQIGGTILLTQLYAVAYLPGTPQQGSFSVVSIRLKKNAGSFAAANITLNFNEIAICNPTTNVTVIT